MSVGERHTFSSQPVEVRRRNSAVGVEYGDIAVTHIVRKDDQDVWPKCLALGHSNVRPYRYQYEYKPKCRRDEVHLHKMPSQTSGPNIGRARILIELTP
jgi:hypothetical protein